MSQDRKLDSVFVMGAGQMGNGIAHVSVLAGKSVVISDISEEHVHRAIATIKRNMSRQVAGGKLEQSAADEAVARIRYGTIEDVAGADLVVEAIVEDAGLKGELYQKIVPNMQGDALLASNTSSIPITRLAAMSGIGERFIGLHFFNPVPVMQLVEVIRGLQTADETFNAAVAFGKEVGKTPVESRDMPSFIANRILLPMINEAIFVLQEGTGSMDGIDTAMKLGMRHPMGPLQLADYIGLDTCLSVLDVMTEGTGDTKYRAAPLLRTYVQAGWLGVKTGRGFYDYSGDKPIPTR